MRRNFYQRHKNVLDRFGGLFLDNPVLERGLVLAPVVVASYSCVNSVILGLSFLCITFVTVLISSFISKKIPYAFRIVLYTLIACTVFAPTAMLMNQMFPQTVFKIGVFLPLLVANSLIVVKSESRFHKHKRGRMALDLFCHCLGFLWVILLVGCIRELFGSGSLFGVPLAGMPTVPALLMPFSGFILVGFLAALVKLAKRRADGTQAEPVSGTVSAMDRKGSASRQTLNTERTAPQTRTERTAPQTRTERTAPQTRTERTAPQTRTERTAPQTRTERTAPQTRTERTAPQTRTERTAPQTRTERTAPQTRTERTAPQTRTERIAPQTRKGRA